MHQRVSDPVGKLEKDLRYMNFRRNLLLCIARKQKDFAICVHDKCRSQLDRAGFPSEMGEFMKVEVEDKTGAKKKGAWAYLCLCALMDSKAGKEANAQLPVHIRPQENL